jgi:ribosomal protein S6--L-glutamate ligase
VILSFHPCIDADINIIVAGRAPGPKEEASIKGADAIIIPQGARQDLYDLCRKHCKLVFPNYDHRYHRAGKIGDTLIFRQFGIPHPSTRIFQNVAQYRRRFPPQEARSPYPFPFVLKGNFSGEGHMVYKIYDHEQLQNILDQLRAMERSGLQGFIVQQWIDHGGRDIRVVVLYDKLISYWRVQKDPQKFLTNLSAGAVIDPSSDPNLRQQAESTVLRLCQQTGINLAGVDLMLDQNDNSSQPLLIEINYWFGRRFFGSSEAYYGELKKAVKRWLATFDPGWPKRIR